jgi:hypothetical protein
MTMHQTRFTVEGAGPFPIDMLRYDCCFPETEFGGTAAIMSEEIRGVRHAKLMVRHEGKGRHQLTPARWASFGWRIVEIEGKAI